MTSSVLVGLLLVLGLVDFGASRSVPVDADSACVVDLDQGPFPLPILVDQSGEFVLPQRASSSSDRSIRVAAGGQVVLLCPGNDNGLAVVQDTYVTSSNATCVGGSTFRLKWTGEEAQNFDFQDLGCLKNPSNDAVRSGTCQGPDGASFSQISIGFDGGPALGFVPLIHSCHDEDIDATYYSWHHLPGISITAKEHNPHRPMFKEGEFFPDISCSHSYTEKNEVKRMSQLVGSTLGPEYVSKKGNMYLARGHLAPEGDFTFAAWQNATFYYINAVPQWQDINGGNWENLEETVRDKAEQLQHTLQITTGAFQVLSLPDENNNPVDIYMAVDSDGNERLPAPKWMWKVVHDPQSQSAVAVVTLNNPHADSVSESDLLCTDVCDNLPWITEGIRNRKNTVKGYTYCCSVADLRSAIDYAPDLGDLPLLQ